MQSSRSFIRSTSRWAIAAMVFCSLSCGALQNKDGLYTATHQQLQVVRIVVAQEDAWNSGNLEGFLSAFKDDPETQAVLGTSVKGLANIRSAYRLNYPNRETMGTIAYSNVEARELGDKFALATGRYHLERSKKTGGPADGTITEVLQETPKGWQVIFSETT